MNKASETKRVYNFDRRLKKYLKINSSTWYCRMHHLRELAQDLWAHYNFGVAPEIVAGEGMKFGKRRVSYVYVDGTPFSGDRIVLARHERNGVDLCHELAHAIEGTTDHGFRYCNRYFELLIDAHIVTSEELMRVWQDV